MIILIISWFVCGFIASAVYIIACICRGKITLFNISFSIALLILGYISLVYLICEILDSFGDTNRIVLWESGANNETNVQ